MITVLGGETSSWTGANINGVSSKTFTLTVPSGTDCVVVGIGLGDFSRTISGATLAGQTVTKIDSQYDTIFSGGDAWLGRYLSPAAGSRDLVVSMSGNGVTGTVLGFYALYLQGVDQGTPCGTPSKAVGQTATPTVSPASATGDVVVDIANSSYDFSARGAGQTASAGTTGYSNVNTSTTGGNFASSYEAGGAGTTTMSWTVSADCWRTVAVAFKPNLGPTILPGTIWPTLTM